VGKLEGKVALITGGGRGIGRGISEVLAREGAAVVIADIDMANATRTAEEFRNNGRRAAVVEMDVTSPASVEAGVQTAIGTFGRIDILVNNAGVVGSHVGGAAVTEDDWDRCYEVNLKGSWLVTRALALHFKSNDGGKIVNIASIAGRKGGAGLAHYSASKAGAISLNSRSPVNSARSTST